MFLIFPSFKILSNTFCHCLIEFINRKDRYIINVSTCRIETFFIPTWQLVQTSLKIATVNIFDCFVIARKYKKRGRFYGFNNSFQDFVSELNQFRNPVIYFIFIFSNDSKFYSHKNIESNFWRNGVRKLSYSESLIET